MSPAHKVAADEASDSEGEDEANHVVLPQKMRGKGNAASMTSAVKLHELGPRVTLKLFKVWLFVVWLFMVWLIVVWLFMVWGLCRRHLLNWPALQHTLPFFSFLFFTI